MSEVHNYSVNVKWNEQRKGFLSSPTLDTIEVATPPEFPNGHAGIWSPEHYFVAAVASCLMTTFLAIAENSKLDYQSFDCKATGRLEKVDGKFMMTTVELEPELVISNELDKGKAERVLQKSEAACLISNSVKSSICIKPIIRVG